MKYTVKVKYRNKSGKFPVLKQGEGQDASYSIAFEAGQTPASLTTPEVLKIFSEMILSNACIVGSEIVLLDD